MTGYCSGCGNTQCVCAELPLRDQIAVAISVVLDRSGTDYAAADAVLAVPGVAAALRIAAAVEAEPMLMAHCLQPEWQEGEGRGHNELLARLRAVGKDTDQPAIRATEHTEEER